jgi:hypothetical protein
LPFASRSRRSDLDNSLLRRLRQFGGERAEGSGTRPFAARSPVTREGVGLRPGALLNVKPQVPLSFQGPTPASTIAQKLAGYLGMTPENNGVNAVLTNPYYASDAVSKIRMLAEHAGFDWIMDRGVLAITPPGQARAGDPVLISPQTGMSGYPEFVSPNVVVKALFNPNVRYLGLIQVQSELTPACGIWKVIKLDLDLESKVPQGMVPDRGGDNRLRRDAG